MPNDRTEQQVLHELNKAEAEQQALVKGLNTGMTRENRQRRLRDVVNPRVARLRAEYMRGPEDKK